MQKKGIAVWVTVLAVIICICSSPCVSAESYLLKEDFASVNDCKFLIPGDMDADGEVVADDLVLLKQLILSKKGVNYSYADVYKNNGETAKYSDINGDGFVNLIDLVRQKKNLAQNSLFVAEGAMSLNGNSALKGTFNAALSTDAVYDVCLTYKSDYPVKIKVAASDKEIIFDASQNVTTVVKSFETSSTVNDTEDIEFQIIGVALIEDISVVRVNMDNDIADNW